MKLLIEVEDKKHLKYSDCGIILPLEGYSVESVTYFSMEEIIDIVSKCSNDVFIKMNKNFMNEDIDSLKDILIKLDKLPIQGVFFYDLAVLELKKELSLSIDLVWNQTHMVNNYKTCEYYHSKGVRYALLGKEITLEEIEDIIKKSSIETMVEVVSMPSVAFSKRKLLTNYYKDLGENQKNNLTIHEKVTDKDYEVYENSDGTSFFYKTITNGTGVIKDLYEFGCSYIIIREYGLKDIFPELVLDTVKYIEGKCLDKNYVEKYKILGDNTNFFFKKTIYRVKKK